MALFGSKKDDNNVQDKPLKDKKKKKEDTTPIYDNPAFEIVDPGSSFNVQSGFIQKSPETTPVEILTTPQPEQPSGQPIDPAMVQQMVTSSTPTQVIDATTVQRTVSPAQPIDPAMVQQVISAGVQPIPEQAVQQLSYDPITGQPLFSYQQQPDMDYTTAQPYDPAMVPAGYDPITGLPMDQAQQQTNYDVAAGLSMNQAYPQESYDPVTGQPIETMMEPGKNNQQQNVASSEQVETLQPLPDIDPSKPQTSPTDTPVQAGQATGSIVNNQKVQRPVFRYRYVVINSVGKKENGTFEAESEDDVRSFLLSQDYQVLEVKERAKSDIDISIGDKLGASDLSFSLTQLSTYLRAGIPLADSVKILAKQTKKPNLKKHFNQLVYQLLKGESLSEAMLMQGNVFPKLLINMVKTAEMTGDLPSILDDMSEYYTTMDQTRKQMKSAMTYPVVVLFIALGVLVFMLTYLVPQFSSMFKDQGADMPFITKMIINISEFVSTKWMFILFFVLVIVGTFYMLFKNVKGFKKGVQIVLMHLPVVKDVIIYNEMANFAKTFASLLNHSVFITDSMEILSKITENEVYKTIINNTLENLSKGESISTAFRGQWAIPVVAYEMIVTGESTGQLGAMMEKVAAHFQMLHKNVIDQMKSLVEPIMIVVLAGVVGVILVSIILPMFSIYSQIK